MMKITSYVFQSPYPSMIQVGRPDPLAKEAIPKENDSALKANNKTVQKVALYKAEHTSVSVVNSLSNSTVVKSLKNFTDINSLTQASKAYSF